MNLTGPLSDAELFGSFIPTDSSYPAGWFQANLQILQERETGLKHAGSKPELKKKGGRAEFLAIGDGRKIQ